MTLYVPPHFREEDEAALLSLVEKNAFGTLVSASPEGRLHVSHIPFEIRREGGALKLLGHLARNNPQWEALEGAREIVAIFEGPHAYVSPGWYQVHPSVPTWNYAVVHAHGKARLMDEAELHELVAELSAKYESGREKPWRMGDLPADYVHNMLKAIVGFELAVEKLDGKFKLSQNRPADHARVVAALEAEGASDLAALMREHAPAKG
jgi:transcriptional regulator